MSDVRWIRSTHSGGANENCVEARITRSEVFVRDSKNANGPVFAVPRAGWAAFVGEMRIDRAALDDSGAR